MDATTFAAQEPKHGLRRLMPFIQQKQTAFVLTVTSAVLAQVFTVVTAATGAWLVGHAVRGASSDTLKSAVIVLATAVVLTAVFKWLQIFIAHDFAYSLVQVLQVGVYDGLERAAPAYVLGRRTGELASVATADADILERFYAHMLADYIGAVIVPLGVLITLAVIHPTMAAVLLPFLPLVASVPFWLAKRAGAQGRELLTALGGLNAEVAEGIQGQRELASFGAGRSFLAKLMKDTRAVHWIQMRYGSRAGLEQACIDVLLALGVLATVTTGLYLVSTGRLDFAYYPICVVLAGAALAPITEVTQTARGLGELRAGAERVSQIFHQKAQVNDAGRSDAAKVADSSVTFDAVRFDYGAGRGAVLAGMDFELKPGETVALVGTSGAGKTTCASLLMRFWDASAGTIRLGGCDLRDLPLDELRKRVALVPQDVYLFNGTVADNIRLGKSDATQDDIERAARIAQAHDFIMMLPKGYDTPCGERGLRLSGGQRQRIAIARALVREAPVLVMDEAVANLDTENEMALQAALREIRGTRTLLIIAHRPSTIRSADRILVLRDGRIVEQGTHDALMTQGGIYARLIAEEPQQAAE